MRRGGVVKRGAVVVALAAAVGLLAFVLLGGGGGYAIDARFVNAGNLVTIAGEQVGKVEGIRLSDVPARVALDAAPPLALLARHDAAGPRSRARARRRSPRSASSPRTSKRSSPICSR